MKRREFIRASALGTAALVTAGCGQPPGTLGMDMGPDATGADGPDQTACTITESNIEGPFYTPGAPERSVLVMPDMPGTRLVVQGRVLDSGCAPLAGATVDVWQANDAGAYDSAGFVLRGVMTTDASGGFELHTIIPGHYLNGSTYRPAHIHVKASAPGHELLTTQLYFEGDPYNEGDPWIRDSLTMALEEMADGSKLARYDIVLVQA
jgi:protocatechuate 3,4-dioxygenase beta subunit